MIDQNEDSVVHILVEPLTTDNEQLPAISDVTEIVAREQKAEVALETQRYAMRYIFLPGTFLLVAMLGGIRFSGLDGSVVYQRPALIYLIFGAGLMALFFLAGLIHIDGWVSDRFTLTTNIINGITLAALYAASVQIFNSVIPETGTLFWLVSFCFLWTLWNNLFANFDTKRLLRSLAAMFGFAFVVKYLILPYLSSPVEKGWLIALLNNPGKAAATWLLDLPQFSAATGYLQFFVAVIFVIALYFFPRTNEE